MDSTTFDNDYYYSLYPDVRMAIIAGSFASGYDHYIKYGRYEGRVYRISSPGTKILINTTTGRQLVSHNLGRKPSDVIFFDGETQLFFEYYRGAIDVGSDPLNNIVLVTDKNYTNLEINFL